MPSIIPFQAIYPPSESAEKVAVYIESMTLDEARRERDRNPLSYIHILVPDLSGISEHGANSKDVAFAKITENFQHFLDHQVLQEDDQAQLYLVEIRHGNQMYKGIWTLTSIDDYLEGRIKKHELIRPERERLILNYLQKAHLDSNPVLVTYADNAFMDSMISQYQAGTPFLSFQLGCSQHRIWKIGSSEDIRRLQDAFKAMDLSYIADGHHRAAAFASYGLKRREADSQYTGEEAYNFFSTVYMAAKELEVSPYHRLIRDLNGLATVEFLQAVRRSFHINQVTSSKDFSFPGSFIMYLDGMFFNLLPKDHIVNRKGIVANLEVSLLQDFILASILNIIDSGTDSQISFRGGDMDESQLLEKVDKGEFRVLFLLNSIPMETIMKVADAGEIMPPKSTYVRPKFPVGLLIHKMD